MVRQKCLLFLRNPAEVQVKSCDACNLFSKGSANNHEQERERGREREKERKERERETKEQEYSLPSDLIPIPVLNAPPCVPTEQNAVIKMHLKTPLHSGNARCQDLKEAIKVWHVLMYFFPIPNQQCSSRHPPVCSP